MSSAATTWLKRQNPLREWKSLALQGAIENEAQALLPFLSESAGQKQARLEARPTVTSLKPLLPFERCAFAIGTRHLASRVTPSRRPSCLKLSESVVHSFCTSADMAFKIDEFHAREGEDITMWLRRWTILKATKNWQDTEAISNAVLNLGQSPFQWYIMHASHITQWEDFYQAILTRYGEDEQTLMLRLQHRNQQENESVQSYADGITLLFMQTGFPASAQRDIFLHNLKASLRRRAINTCPKDLQDAIKKATFLEAQDNASSPLKLKTLQEKGSSKPPEDAIDQLTKSMTGLTNMIANRGKGSHTDQASKGESNRPPRDGMPTVICYKCGKPGHKASQCRDDGTSPQVQHYTRNKPVYEVPSDCKVPFYTYKRHYVGRAQRLLGRCAGMRLS